MSDLVIAGGSPTSSEEQAVRDAIESLRRLDAVSQRASNPWRDAALHDGARQGLALRGGWRWSGRIDAFAVTPTQNGRGDAK